MEKLAGDFLMALTDRNAASLPLTKGARYTENGQSLGFDQGLWQTGATVGAYRNVTSGPKGHEFTFSAAIDENGRKRAMLVRIKFVTSGSLNRGLGTLPPLDFVQIGEVELVTG